MVNFNSLYVCTLDGVFIILQKPKSELGTKKNRETLFHFDDFFLTENSKSGN